MLPTTSVTTIERFILDQESRYPEATGELSNLLYDIALAAKIIAASIRRAGLVNILGAMGSTNVQGEEQQKLDVFANETMKNCLLHTGRVCVMGSEEDDDIIPIPPEYPAGQVRGPVRSARWLLQHRRQRPGRHHLQHLPPHQHGRAGAPPPTCCSRGASRSRPATSCTARAPCWCTPPARACTASRSIPTIGEFLLSSHNIVTPRTGQYYSVNESNFGRWSRPVQAAVRGLKGETPDRMKPKNSRYAGSLVADFHRNLIAGGIFLYPGDSKNPKGKLRLLYEAAPMAFIAEQAEGPRPTAWIASSTSCPPSCTSARRW